MRAFLLAAALVAASAAEPLPALANLPAQPGAAVVYLLTFPGSGNTWVRHLIQEGTRVYAGSQYHAHQLEENGFPSDALGAGAYARLSACYRPERARAPVVRVLPPGGNPSPRRRARPLKGGSRRRATWF